MSNLLKFSLLVTTLFYSIKGFGQPVANFSANQLQGCAPLLVQFNSLSTNSPATYFWEFGNGNTSVSQNPAASYLTPGKYTVKLTAGNSFGSGSKTVIDFITVYPLPIVAFGAPNNTGCSPLSILFLEW